MGELLQFDPSRRKNKAIVTPEPSGVSARVLLDKLNQAGLADHETAFKALVTFKAELERASEIRTGRMRQAAVLAAAQEGFSAALRLADDPLANLLREKVVSTLTGRFGSQKAASYVESWKTHHVTLKRQKSPAEKPLRLL